MNVHLYGIYQKPMSIDGSTSPGGKKSRGAEESRGSTDSRDPVESRGEEDSRDAVEARGGEDGIDMRESLGDVDPLEAAEVRAWEDWLDSLESGDGTRSRDERKSRAGKRLGDAKRSSTAKGSRAGKRSTDMKRSHDEKRSRGAKKSKRTDGKKSQRADSKNSAPSTPGSERGDRLGTPITELGLLAEETLALAIATRATEAQLLRAQASILAWLAEGNRVEQCGFASLSSLALEVVGIRPRTVRERLALHRIFLRHPAMERAFLAGKMTACQALAVAPFLAEWEAAVAAAAVAEASATAAAAAPAAASAAASAASAADATETTSPASQGTRPHPDPDFDWASATSHLSVRELRFQARQVLKEKSERDRARHREEHPDEPEGRTISFTAPAGFQVVFEQMMELARKVLGRDAPIYECFEAMLLETDWLGIGPQQEPLRYPERRSIPIIPRDNVPHREEAIAHARETLTQVRAYIKDVADLIEPHEPKSPHDALSSLRQIHLLRAPQKVLFARLLRDLRRTQAMDLLGYRSMAELVEDRLRLSERSARNRVAESLLFESDEEIARAFAAGEISIMQAHLIRRLSSSFSRRPFVARAREVTWRQFQRESRLLELLRKCDLGRVADKPFPQARVEEALIAALGGDRESIEIALFQHGIPPLPPGGSGDPAENPILMDRLEMLVHLLALRQWDDVPATGDADRQTSAAARREVTIRFWAPLTVAGDLSNVMNRYRKQERPWIPMWAAMTVLFAQVTEIWEQQDPERRPVRSKILKRDHYRCVIPGCTSRSHLETSHNRPRSQGGTNDAENLSVVCHTHHHRGIHAGYVAIGGRAPYALRFMLGLRREGPPLLIYKGNRLVKGPFDAAPREGAGE